MKVLHFLTEKTPNVDESRQAQIARSAGDEYRFVSAEWASKNPAIECDKVAGCKDCIKKYAKPEYVAPKELAKEPEPKKEATAAPVKGDQ